METTGEVKKVYRIGINPVTKSQKMFIKCVRITLQVPNKILLIYIHPLL